MSAAAETLNDQLARLELFEPELGQLLRQAPRLRMLTAGQAELRAWETSSLTFMYGDHYQPAFDALARGLRLPDSLLAALLRREQSGRHHYSWNWEFGERVEHLTVAHGQLELSFVNRRGPQRLRLMAPPLTPAQTGPALEWLSQPETLRTLAEGRPVDVAELVRLELLPAWDACELAATARAREVVEAGALFICRALVVHPVFLPILRGLEGEAAVRQCAERVLARRQTEFEVAAQRLPADPDEFWRAAAAPELPLPHAVPPEPGLGAHLPPADFWARPEDNRLLAETLAKVYKNIPRRLARLTIPRRFY